MNHTVTTVTLKVDLKGPGMTNLSHNDMVKWMLSCLNCNTRHIHTELVSCHSMVNLKTVPVQIRRDRETGQPVLFFRNSNSHGKRWLDCYDLKEGHSEVDDAYRLRCEKLDARKLPDDALRLLSAWNQLPGDYGVPVQRLPRM